MNKNILRIAGLIGFTVMANTAAWAEILLKDSSEIAGTWHLESVALGIDKPKIVENRTWEFRTDGVIVTSGYNKHLGMEDRHEWKYQIVGGKIVSENPGRPGKPIEYMVYEKTADTMILKGGIEGFYFFKK